MFEVMGMSKLMQESITSMSGNMRPMLLSSLPPGDYRERLADLFITKFQSKIQVNQLVELAIPIYAKYYTKEEIAALTEFYKTPLGKKTVSVTPQTMSDMQVAARKIGEEAGRASMMEVLAEHPDLAKSLEDASAGSMGSVVCGCARGALERNARVDECRAAFSTGHEGAAARCASGTRAT